MSDEDVVQVSEIGYFAGRVNTATLFADKRRGIGVLTRTGVGAFDLTLPAGRGIDNNDFVITSFQSTNAAFGTVDVAKGTSTDTVKKIEMRDAAGALVDLNGFVLVWGALLG